MKLLIGLMPVLLAATSAGAQTVSDRQAVEQLPTRFTEAWNKHDGHALAALMAEDVDFVNVGALWLQGRRDFETYHTRLLEGRFSSSTKMPLERRVRFLSPEIALLHWSWRIEGDRNFDGTPRPSRVGLFTMIVEKREGNWQVAAAQNTNAIPGRAPEEAGIASPIAMPQ